MFIRNNFQQEKNREQQDSNRIPLLLIFTEPHSSCSKKLEHPPNQQKSMRTIPRRTNENLQEKQKIKRNNRSYTYGKR